MDKLLYYVKVLHHMQPQMSRYAVWSDCYENLLRDVISSSPLGHLESVSGMLMLAACIHTPSPQAPPPIWQYKRTVPELSSNTLTLPLA